LFSNSCHFSDVKVFKSLTGSSEMQAHWSPLQEVSVPPLYISIETLILRWGSLLGPVSGSSIVQEVRLYNSLGL
jgi:hypothetical protein